MNIATTQQSCISNYKKIRQRTETLCKPLKIEDYIPQPIESVSPPKWHLAHTTWFFEQFILVEHLDDYQVFDDDFGYLFNSYYNHFGERLLKPNRGLMTRPVVEKVFAYRSYVDGFILELLEKTTENAEVFDLIQLGLQHEQQHQELLMYDIKYILGFQPTFPEYGKGFELKKEEQAKWISLEEGVYEIGAKKGFSFDNEHPVHKTYCHQAHIRNTLVSNEEYIAFIKDGGYQKHSIWLAEGWDFINNNDIKAPLYWHKKDGEWWHYTLQGLVPIDIKLPVCHISFYEAMAFAEWSGFRLPTEEEWEVLSDHFNWGQLWEWTNSAYLPYPGFKKLKGALGEYNGKFMVNQHVLRGASVVTPEGHSRKTYRNFYPTKERWLYSGIRLAK